MAKLPDINYGTPTASQGRYGSRAPELIQAAGRVEGAGITDAGKILGSAIGRSGSIIADARRSAGTMRSRGIYDAQKWANDTIARNQIREANLEIETDLRMHTTIARVLGDVLNTGAQAAIKHIEARKTSEVSSKHANYSNRIRQTSAEVFQGPQVNIAEYDDIEIDRTDLDITPVYDQAGNVTEEWVPTDQVGEQIVNKREAKYRAEAMEEVSGAYEEDLTLKLDNTFGEIKISNTTSTFKYHQDRTSAIASVAVENYVKQGDLRSIKQLSYQMEARGVWKVGTAEKIIAKAEADITYSSYLGMIDGLQTEAQVDALRETITEDKTLDRTAINQLRTQLSGRDSEIRQEVKIAEAESYSRRFSAEIADTSNEVLGGITVEAGRYTDSQGNPLSETEVLDSIVKKMPDEFAKDASSARTIAKQRLNEFNANSNAIVTAKADGWWNKYYETEGAVEKPVKVENMPAGVYEQQLKAWKARMNGHDVVTDLNKWYELQEIALKNPEAYPTITQLRQNYGGVLAQPEMERAIKLGQDLTGDGKYQTQAWLSKFNADFDELAKSAYGLDYQTNPKKYKQAQGLKFYSEIIMGRLPEDTSPEDRKRLLYNLFNSTAYTTFDETTNMPVQKDYMFRVDKFGWGTGSGLQSGLSLVDSPIEEYLPEISNALIMEGKTPSVPAVISRYNLLVEQGKITPP